MFSKTQAGSANSGRRPVTERPLICTSLRKRLDWASLPEFLVQSHNPCGRWKETHLATHDVAVPLTARRVFRAIFLSAQDVASSDCLTRLERLYSLNAGQLSGIVFLMKDGGEQQSAVHALMTLQIQLIGGRWDLPIFPVDSVAAVPESLAVIRSEMCSTVVNRGPANPARQLLPLCSDSVPLTEHTVNILTDTTSDFTDLLDKLSTNALFESDIALLLGDDADKLRNFWADDYSVD